MSKATKILIAVLVIVIILIISRIPKVKEIYCGKEIITSEKPRISIPCETDEDCYNKINELNIFCKQGYELHCDNNLCNCILLQSL